MTIQEIYDLALKLGMKADPRGEVGVKRYLARMKKEYEALPKDDKEYFEKTKLVDPYADSFIHFVANAKIPVKRVLAGIDIDSGEIFLADRLNERGKKIDLVIGHHPIGRALVDLAEVMDLQVEVLESYGVPTHVADNLMQERMSQVDRGIHVGNQYQVVDIARLLGISVINTHTLTDNLVEEYLNGLVKARKPHTVGDVLKILDEQPEYQQAKREGTGPKLLFGRPSNRAGKVMTEMTGGTNPGDRMYEELSKAGVSTIISMHLNEKSLELAKKSFMNVIIAGHMSSDSLGMNLFLDELEQKGIEIVPCSGLMRASRTKKGKK